MNIEKLGKRCCGCGVCEAVCPKKCITLRADSEGFSVPVVDAQACVDCGLCLRRCPVEQAETDEDRGAPTTYAAHARDDEALAASSSGAMFTALAEDTLARGGRVYGAVMETPGDVRIVGTDEESGLAPMRRSKYVQGSIGGETLAEVKETLEAGRDVLFTGCPCQVAALKSYLNKPYDGLTTAEIVCHGVPSPLLFKTYLQTLEKGGNEVTDYVFRDKSKGWGMFFRYELGGKSVCRRSTFDPFMNNFMYGRIYRESCYQCAFARKNRVADLTLGDFWGVLKEYPELYDPRGLSAVLVSTSQGEAAFARIAETVEHHEVAFDRVAKHNENLVRPSRRPAARDTIYEGLGTNPRYVHDRLKVQNSVKDVVKALLPTHLKDAAKKLLRR